MNQQLLGGLTAALVTATVGVALPSHADTAEDSDQVQSLNAAALSLDEPGDESAELTISALSDGAFDGVFEGEVLSEPDGQPELTPELRLPSSEPSEEDGESDSTVARSEVRDDVLLSSVTRNTVAHTLSHDFQGRDATTLYVRGIPVLTFLSSEDAAQPDAALTQVTGHTWRATSVAAKINELSREGVDAETIVAKWNPDQEHYAIAIGEEELATITAETILPDTTQRPAEDVLQATNRLRRLLGYAQPLEEIEGKPTFAPTTYRDNGIASWYGPGFHGRQSASGEIFNQNALTAAHRTLPFGTRVRVTNLYNGAQVVVRINDRGPYSGGRVIDLSAAAAQEIGMLGAGVASVQIEVLDDIAASD